MDPTTSPSFAQLIAGPATSMLTILAAAFVWWVVRKLRNGDGSGSDPKG